MSWINIFAEQATGQKMRSRTVRGYKSWQGMYTALLLTGLGAAFKIQIWEGVACLAIITKYRQLLIFQIQGKILLAQEGKVLYTEIGLYDSTSVYRCGE